MSNLGNNETVLGMYRIGKCIGQGTFGKVRLGTHIITEEKVAVKTLQKQKIIEKSDIERVTREICILKVLRHPNIIQLYEIIETKTDIHLIMEYAEGGELFDYIVKSKKLDEKDAGIFMQQILSGVEYIHKNGIVHRDLKPQNLLLDHKKNIKIVDFGLSNQYKPGEKLKTACGSPCYAAPEMIAGKRYECLNADIWSCGIILYAMLCGYLPFEDPNTNKLYKKIIAGDFEMPKFLSSESRDILRNILNVNPDTRFTISQIRQTRWYNLSGEKYEAKGIIVGKDAIEPDEKLIRKMQKFKCDSTQARTYIINNRHNNITALYYLLKMKEERNPTPEEPEEQPVVKPELIKKREESPLIYRPQKKEYYLGAKKPKEKESSKNNDSMNASNIISALVKGRADVLDSAANRFKKQEGVAEKLEHFRPFPKKKNSSSIREPTSATRPNKSPMNQDSQEMNRKSLTASIDQGRYHFNNSHYNPKTASISEQSKMAQNPHNDRERDDSLTINKKRQELSDQLKHISLKIDKEISDLKKQNNNMLNTSIQSSNKKRESIGGTTIGGTSTPIGATGSGLHSVDLSSNSQKKRTIESHDWVNSSKEKDLNMSKDSQNGHFPSRERARTAKQGTHVPYPKVYQGPFNTQCLFLENSRTLISKITNYLIKSKIKYQEENPFSLLLSDGEIISVESLKGTSGLHLVRLSNNTQLNQNILDTLSR